MRWSSGGIVHVVQRLLPEQKWLVCGEWGRGTGALSEKQKGVGPEVEGRAWRGKDGTEYVIVAYHQICTKCTCTLCSISPHLCPERKRHSRLLMQDAKNRAQKTNQASHGSKMNQEKKREAISCTPRALSPVTELVQDSLAHDRDESGG